MIKEPLPAWSKCEVHNMWTIPTILATSINLTPLVDMLVDLLPVILLISIFGGIIGMVSKLKWS